MSSSECCERVLPDNGRQETRWVMLTLVLVLLAGVFGLVWRQQAVPAAPPNTSLNTQDSRLLTELAIASEEIRFMTPDGKPWPTPAQLTDAGVPPFDRAGLRWQQPETACYATTEPTTGAAFALWLAPEGGLFYHPDGKPPHHCHDLAHWTRMDKSR